MSDIGVIYTNNNITVTRGDETKTLSTGDELFDKCVNLWKQKDFNGLIDTLWSTKKVVENAYEKYGFKVRDGVVFVNDKPIVDSLAKRIVEYANKGLSPDRLLKFWDRLVKNPSYWCVQSLFDFLDRNRCPINDDGRFMAFKAVTRDFKDKYTKTVDNRPGTKVKPFERNQVDDDKQKQCSFGYHVGSASYVRGFGVSGDKFIEVLVDPADVVSIPEDVNQDKIRVCTYEVVKEIDKNEINYTKYNDVYGKDNQAEGNMWDDEDEYDDEDDSLDEEDDFDSLDDDEDIDEDYEYGF
jgi:hypothetical protein